MSQGFPGQTRPTDNAPLDTNCPSWCVAPHGMHRGEEDWVHTSEPLPLTDRVVARLCMTVDPVTETQDGPYVLIGGTELTPAQANDIGLAMQALADVARATGRA